MLNPSKNWLFFAILLGSILIYAPVLLHSNFPARDDGLLIEPLKTVSSISDYMEAMRSGKIIDFAPIRDASFLIDLKLADLLGFPVFNLTNLILWWLILATLLVFLRNALNQQNNILLALTLYSIHPMFVNSVAWISARKHLLASLFFLLASISFDSYLKGKRQKMIIASALFYAASLFSNPIAILAPLWFFGCNLKKIQNWTTTIPSLLLMLFGGGANYYYYSSTYLKATQGTPKFLEIPDSAVGNALLAVGRSWAQFYLPLKISPVDYFPGASMNLVGIAGIVVFFFVCYKNLGKEDLLKWGSLFLFPLLILNLKPTRVFLSDTYLLIPSFAFMVLTLKLLANFAIPRKILIPASLLIITSFFIRSSHLAQAWASNEKYWAEAFAIEPTPQVVFIHASNLLLNARHNEARVATYPYLDWSLAIENIYIDSLLGSTDLTSEQKLREIQTTKSTSFMHTYATAALALQQNNLALLDNTFLNLRNSWNKNEENTGTINAEILFFCATLKKNECGNLRKEMIEKLKNTSEELNFLQRLKQLNL